MVSAVTLAGLVAGTTAITTGQELSIILGVVVAGIFGPVIMKWRKKRLE